MSFSFNAVNDHVLSGQTDITFTVENSGNADAGPFATQVVWSPNAVVGDSDDIVVAGSTVDFPGLAVGAMTSRTINAQLDKAALFAHSLASDASGAVVGTVSMDVSHLFLVVDAAHAVAEGNETNNAEIAKGVSSDDITYFPWDKNSNGTIEPLEALSSVQAVGTADAASDLNADGLVSPFEALSALQRIGYIRNAGVMGDSGAAAVGVQSVAPTELVSVQMLPRYAVAVVAAEPIDVPVAATFGIVDDEPGRSLFSAAADSDAVLVMADPTDNFADIDQTFATPNWLSVVS